VVIETPDAAPRFKQAPGGSASIILGGDTPWGDDENEVFRAETVSHAHQTKQKVGKEPRSTITYMPSGRVHQAPGGASSICLGSDDYLATPSQKVSSNKFANGANQNCGNTITDRSTTRLHHAPGGASTICLGGSDEPVQKVSANHFANGANQNCGNTITDRSTTRLHHAPGGASSICLGSLDAPLDKAKPAESVRFLGERQGGVSSNMFANGSNQNCGNVLTDKPSTRLHQAPGGTSTVCLGSYAGDENMDTSNQAQVVQEKPMRKHTSQEVGGGGATTVILG